MSELDSKLKELRLSLREIYPDHSEQEINSVWSQLLQILDPYYVNHDSNDVENKTIWDSSSVVLITYPDSIYRKGESTLKTLAEFVRDRLNGLSSVIHVLPFLPSTSDGGFAVSDHENIDETFGDWNDLKNLSSNKKIMADLVLNHVSSSHPWVHQFIKSNEPGSEYIVSPSQTDIWEEVIRPRNSSLFTNIKTNKGFQKVWTTFGPDQIDVDWRNPHIFLEFLKLLVRYINNGAEWIRLDAIAFIWKEPYTTCLHLDPVHLIVKLLNKCLKIIKPSAVLITETNVPEEENLSYLIDGNEANLAYNFTLPPLLLEAIYTGKTDLLNNWLSNWNELPTSTSLLNFTSSHDGIGLRALEGIMDDTRMHDLLVESEKRGGLVSHRRLSSGQDQPYELNISWWSAMSNSGSDFTFLQFERFLLSQVLTLSLKGVPAFYLPSILASPNDLDTFRKTGQRRDLNREKFEANKLLERLKNFDSPASKNISYLSHIIKVRSRLCAFHPEAYMNCISTNIDNCVVIQRGLDENRVYVICNMSDKNLCFPILNEIDLFKSSSKKRLIDNISGSYLNCNSFDLNPYQVVWISLTD
ncbi:alpha-amylase family glycosyl hydrolase [Prochlorococcus marinus]|uniref:Glycosidase n=1 Tax=Prochlorococcus marinus XMU1408 TaxID=2213228 RepID=A0A318R1E9_PROMR|nr:glycosidase [Prochlorococcus marinus str. XMU1408]PYE03287.1 glycosidase [Prochlorococcus marinus XMU1408]